jgi:hypothetical protein
MKFLPYSSERGRKREAQVGVAPIPAFPPQVS